VTQAGILTSLPITPVKGSIKLAANEIQVPRIGTLNKVNFCHNGIKTKHNFDINDKNIDIMLKDLAVIYDQ
jgi:hypothetical protein